MCGITGIFNYGLKNAVDRDVLRRSCQIIEHRGPDDEGFYYDDDLGVGFGHRRLSIIDLSGGRQPMSNAERTIWITFNGEIYNFPELRKELQSRGCRFSTNSDTEVIIYLYQEYAEAAIARLNGIFSFAIYDKMRGCVIIARDHFGVKPMYYYLGNGELHFASEIKAIFEDRSIPRELDFEALNSFLTFRYNPAPQTLFKGVHKLPPSSYLKVKLDGRTELKSYWSSSPATNAEICEPEAISQYQDLLEKAVRRQMISDVPVGLLLSGGVDSAVVGYLMQAGSAKKIKTFTVGFEGSGDYNELDDARITSEFIGSEHYELTVSQQEYLDFFWRSFYYTEEPIAESTIPALYYVCHLASQHLKVVLAGQGADEPLAGYKRYLGEKYLSRYAPLFRMAGLQSLVRLLPRNESLKRALYASQFRKESERFLGIYTIFTPEQKSLLFRREIQPKLNDIDISFVENHYASTANLLEPLSRLLYIDTRMSLSDDLLIFGDKMSMANSLEMRVPFLDVDFIEFVESLPTHFKLNGFTRKYIHKKAVKKWLPNKIIYRKKRGFATPMDEWLQNDLAATTRKIVNGKNSASRNYFNLTYINTLIDKHQRRQENYQRHIFALLSFEVWHKSFFDHEKVDLMP